MKRVDTEAIQVKGTEDGEDRRQSREWIQRLYESRVPQRDEKRGNKESGCGGCRSQGYNRGRKQATIKRVDTEAIRIQGTAEGGEARQ